jgi:Ca2+-transporting ATPase
MLLKAVATSSPVLVYLFVTVPYISRFTTPRLTLLHIKVRQAPKFPGNMANSNAPNTPSKSRKRAPTITTMGQLSDDQSPAHSSGDSNTWPTQAQQSPQELRNANSFESNASSPTSPLNVSSPQRGLNGTYYLAVPGARSRCGFMDSSTENGDPSATYLTCHQGDIPQGEWVPLR